MNRLTLESQYKKYPKGWPQFVIGAVVVTLIIIIWNITVEYEGFTQRGWSIVGVAIRGLFTPSWDVISDMSASGLLYMLFETFAIGFLGTIFGTIIAIPLAFISSRNIALRWVNLIMLAVITLIRAFPSIMYGIMFVKTVGPGAYAGVLTMTIGSVGMLSKLLVESVEDINPGIIESLDAAGCTGFQKVRYGMMPQLSSSIISNVLYRLDINVKNASVLGLVGAGGIGAQLIFAIQDRRWSDAGAMLWGLVILVLLIEYISTKIRNLLATKS
ncbi:MAG: phosphonate ABC transporter, permease protein PhnE [Eubacteriales bacterium]|nr:phosphonate ABC transporter, permease protein PhnE [Eubacteriales bacterium]